MDTSALEALASMARVLRALAFERHPIVDRPVCCIELDGDAVLFDEAEIRTAADHALQVVISTELQKFGHLPDIRLDAVRSEEHTSELQSLMRISYAVFCLKKKKTDNHKSA